MLMCSQLTYLCLILYPTRCSPQMVGSPPSAATSWAAVNAVRQLLEAHSELTRYAGLKSMDMPGH
jgi:hypothetical protein